MHEKCKTSMRPIKKYLFYRGLFLILLLTRKIEIAIIPNINERTKAFLFGG